jgi:hypothetical protein
MEIDRADQLEFMHKVDQRRITDLKAENDLLETLLLRLRAAVSLYVHSRDHGKDYLVAALEESSIAGAE